MVSKQAILQVTISVQRSVIVGVCKLLFSFYLLKLDKKEALCTLPDLLALIMTLWQWFTLHCNALGQQYYICICVEAWKHKTTCVPHYKHACADKGNIYRVVWGSLTVVLRTTAGKYGMRPTEREGWENKEGEDKQGKRLGSLVQCEEVVLGPQKKREALYGEGDHTAEMIHFKAANPPFPRGNLWLCNVGNALSAHINTEMEMSLNHKQPTSIHLPWHWMKSTEIIKRRCLEQELRISSLYQQHS